MGFWTERKVLVTGGTGLMGGWLVKQLLEAEADVVLLVRDQSPKSMIVRDGSIKRCTIVAGSLADASTLRRALLEHEVDTVFHLAAQPIVGVAKLDPVGTLEANVQGTWNVLEAARHSRVAQIVVASSDKAYGSAEKLPYDESFPLQGRYPYDCSKSCADLITTMYAATYQLPVCTVRCANLFGGGDLNFNRVIPGAIQAGLRGERFVIRSDGKFIRDFLYVKDAALGYLLVAEKLAADRELIGEAFNLSLEVRLNVIELVERVNRLLGRPDLEPVILNQASAEIREQYMISDKSRRVLGWKPAYPLEEGLRETLDWYREFLAPSIERFCRATA
ncbi:MAG TPA: NAD-dependent epimerase/dehydratase family protein [Paludibaculum sp.]|jgi:CDP-glucose 4,6-dehydratase